MNIEEAPDTPTSTRLILKQNVTANKNPYTGGKRFTRLPGARFVLTANYTNVRLITSNWFDAYMATLRGGAALVRVPDLSYTQKGGRLLEGSGVVSTGQAEPGHVLASTGWAANVVDQVLPGDRFSFIDPVTGLEEMHIITDKADSLTDGSLTLTFEPELRRLPPDGTPINIKNPGFTATASKTESPMSREPGKGNFSIEWEECIYAV